MKTLELEIGLIKHLDHRQNLIVPNVSNWSGLVNFEADILMLTKSGYANAFELKVSKSDLKNDLKKTHIKELDKIMHNGKRAYEFYYESLKHFYYVVPENLKECALDQIPSFCGLLVARKVEFDDFERIFFDTIKHPKKLFNKKWNEKERLALARLGTMRILTLKENLNRSLNCA